MEEISKIQVSISPTWDIIEDIRKRVRDRLAGVAIHITEAAEMTSSELTENAVKYGIITEKISKVGFTFEYNKSIKKILIKVTNGINNKEEVNQTLVKIIDKINASDDKEALYTQRLMELLENPQPGISQLGLLRIAYEGGFDLDYHIKDDLVEVSATRLV